MITYTDEELIKGCIDDNRKHQEELYKKYYSQMMTVCMRYSKNNQEAEDLLQDCFLKVFKNIKKYNYNGHLGAWIKKLITNEAIDRIRKKNRETSALEGYKYENEEYCIQKENLYNKTIYDIPFEVSSEKIILGMQSLSSRYRAVFNMYIFEDLSHKEISEKLGISIGTSKSNLHKAKKNMKLILMKELELS